MATVIIEVALVVAVGGMLASAIRRYRAGVVRVPKCRGCGHAVSRAYPRCRRCGVDVEQADQSNVPS